MKRVVSLFDESGNMVRDWAGAGYECHCFDIINTDRSERVGLGIIHYHQADLTDRTTVDIICFLNPVIVFGFPPCTDMAVSGAAHFERKRKADPDFQNKAAALARIVQSVADKVGCPWMAENPVSVLASLWRKPDYSFHPHEYGGYLPADDAHPRWPSIIKPRDAYPKKTCLWCGNGFTLPDKKPVEVEAGYSDQHNKLGGKSAKTKQIRSETPRGFARAVFEHFNSEPASRSKRA